MPVTITKTEVVELIEPLWKHELTEGQRALLRALDAAQAAHIEGGEDNTVTIVVEP